MTDENSEKDRQLRSLAEQLEQDLRNIRRALRKPLEAETTKGELTGPQTAVMREVVRDEGINLRDLSRIVCLAHSTVSGIVDRLEKRGMIERRPDQRDGRVSGIFPTAVVREFVSERIPELNRGPLVRAMSRASRDERATIRSALARLRELLEEQ